MASILQPARTVFFSTTGAPLAGGKVYTYVAGTTQPKTTWQDMAETLPNSNPIVLDSAGSCLMLGNNTYLIEVYDANGVLVSSGNTYAPQISNGPYTVGTLPTGVFGLRAIVTDATTTTFGAAPVGGGTNEIMVTYLSSGWVIG
jgi:hypothetical protein